MVSMSSKRDYYEVLGVENNASDDEIKRAYKKRALANHPDRNPDDEQAIDRFKEAAEAFEVLSDPGKRERYDRYGHAGVSGIGGSSGYSDVNDIFDAFGDLFEGFGFFGGGRARGRRGAHQGASLVVDMLETIQDCQKEVVIHRLEVCETCGGSGAEPGTTPETCDYCGGNGQVVQAQGIFRVQTRCPACRGAGTTIRDKCPDCRGSGRQRKRISIDVTVPAGVDTGMRLRVAGEGEAGEGGGPRGDLFVDLEVRPHPLFHREGADLTCQIPLTYTQAALGTSVEIPLLEGSQSLEVPPGTQPGHVFELRRLGMPDPRGGRRGNLFVEVLVEIPHKVSGRREELLRELAELEQADVSPHRKSFYEKVKEYLAGQSE